MVTAFEVADYVASSAAVFTATAMGFVVGIASSEFFRKR